MINLWVDVWDRKEHPRTLSILRITVALVLLMDLLDIGRNGLVEPLMAAASAGGWGGTANASPALWIHALPVPWGDPAVAIFVVRVVAALGLLLGVGARANALVLALCSAQVALLVPYADRGIDMLLRNVLWILVFARSDGWLSLRAWWQTGSLGGDGRPVPAWPRHLVVLQLVVVYFMAGVQKFGFLWTPMGSYTALYTLLQDEAIARAEWSWLANTPWLQMTQLATLITLLWEWTAPVVLWVYWGRFRPETASRRLRWAVRNNLHLIWLSVGVLFHVGIVVGLQLGIFPWAMLALYVAFVHPEQWPKVGRN